jgi:hypothetical protein
MGSSRCIEPGSSRSRRIWRFHCQPSGGIANKQVEIALTQSRISTAKLNLDLYEKRFKVFEATRRYIGNVFESDSLVRVGIEFDVETAEAAFLFDEKVEKFIDQPGKRGSILSEFRRRLRAMDESGTTGNDRNRIVEIIAEQEATFLSELENLVATFKPYLQLGDI